jgi:tetratricopeptide (TPR) repeat protein
MFELKPLSKNAVPAALAKAERYRLLNEPMQAASICEDILRVEPDNSAARVTLILALSDEFGGAEQASALTRARALLPGLPTEYERAYYSGILAERRGLALVEHGAAGSSFSAYAALREAMDWFEKAEAVRPAENDDAILRWNACARVLMRNPHLQARADERDMPLALE